MDSAVATTRSLKECEAAIEDGFRAAGEALEEIRRNRLYRETHRTFDDDTRER